MESPQPFWCQNFPRWFMSDVEPACELPGSLLTILSAGVVLLSLGSCSNSQSRVVQNKGLSLSLSPMVPLIHSALHLLTCFPKTIFVSFLTYKRMHRSISSATKTECIWKPFTSGPSSNINLMLFFWPRTRFTNNEQIGKDSNTDSSMGFNKSSTLVYRIHQDTVKILSWH